MDTHLIARSIISVPMEHHMSTLVPLDYFGMMLSKHVIGQQMYLVNTKKFDFTLTQIFLLISLTSLSCFSYMFLACLSCLTCFSHLSCFSHVFHMFLECLSSLSCLTCFSYLSSFSHVSLMLLTCLMSFSCFPLMYFIHIFYSCIPPISLSSMSLHQPVNILHDILDNKNMRNILANFRNILRAEFVRGPLKFL